MNFLLQYLKDLPGKWVPILVLLVWFPGGRWLPFNLRLILTLAILGIWGIFFLIKRRRPRKGAEEKEALPENITRFEERVKNAIKSVQDFRGKKVRPGRLNIFKRPDPYLLPWYMVIGPSGNGKTSLLRNSNLDFSYIDSLQERPLQQGIDKTKNCDLFFTREAIILDTSGRYVTYGNEASVRTEWLGLLNVLKKHRPKRPIDGLILTTEITPLLQEEEYAIEQEARKIRQHIEDLIEQLETRLPIYLVFTKNDRIYGFVPFFEDLSPAERTQVWGCTLRSDREEKAEAVFREECRRLFGSLNDRRLPKLASERISTAQRVGGYAFPLEFEAACQKLSHFVGGIFPEVAPEKPIFRGFYFTSAAQEGHPVDLVLRQVAESLQRQPLILPEAPEKRQGYFIKDLFKQIIFPDRGLESLTLKAEIRRTRFRLAFCAVALIAAVALGIGLRLSYGHNRQVMTEVHTAAAEVAETGPSTSSEEKWNKLERLNRQKAKLEGFAPFSLPWRRERREVARAGRELYEKHTIRIPVKVTRELETESDISLKPVVGNAVYPGDYKGRAVYTGEDGQAVLVEVKSAKVVISTDYPKSDLELGGLKDKIFKKDVPRLPEPAESDWKIARAVVETDLQKKEIPLSEPTLSYEISPGEYEAEPAWRVEFIFARKRVVTAHCVDRFGKDLEGVPVSIKDEWRNYTVGATDEKGMVRLEFVSSAGRSLEVVYDDPPAASSSLNIKMGQYEYPLSDKEIRRKLNITVTAQESATQRPRGGVTVLVGGKPVGRTDRAGKLVTQIDIIPTNENVSSSPLPEAATIGEEYPNYTILMQYGATEEPVPTPPPLTPPPPPPPSEPRSELKVVDLSDRKSIQDAEVWAFLEKGDDKLWSSTEDSRRMGFESGGKEFKLVQIGATNKKGLQQLPKEVAEHQFLVTHPQYWPRSVKWQEGTQKIMMTGIKEARAVKDFAPWQMDGAAYYYGRAKEYHKQQKLSEAIDKYQKAIRLMPRKDFYLGLGWTYYEGNQAKDARKQAETGLGLKLLGFEGNEPLIDQQLRELLSVVQ
ncbi:MAG: type VI secretion protein IcmF/TssM N-terminal domain-containing protein [bacterium]